jgi:hypothetical protein
MENFVLQNIASTKAKQWVDWEGAALESEVITTLG